VNTLPCRAVLETSIAPPTCVTMRARATAEPRADAHVLGGEERIEDAIDHVGAIPLPVSATSSTMSSPGRRSDRRHPALFEALGAQRHAEHAAVGHRLDRVRREVLST